MVAACIASARRAGKASGSLISALLNSKPRSALISISSTFISCLISISTGAGTCGISRPSAPGRPPRSGMTGIGCRFGVSARSRTTYHISSCAPTSLTPSPPSSRPWAMKSPLLRWAVAVSEMSSSTSAWKSGAVIVASILPRPSMIPVVVSEFQSGSVTPAFSSSFICGRFGKCGADRRRVEASISSPPLALRLACQA